MIKNTELIQWIRGYYYDEEIIKADGLDDAIIGIEESTMRLIYSKTKVIDILVKDWDMENDDAEEYYWFNIHNTWIGEQTPIWCIDI
jgi:hypothetical protein